MVMRIGLIKLLSLHGAKTVDGFDIHEEMVQQAKLTNSQFSTVTVCHGNVVDIYAL